MATLNINKDRQKFNVLIVEPKTLTSAQLRESLKNLGFTHFSVVSTHIAGLDRLKARNFTHVLFEAKPTDMPTQDFVKAALELESNAVLIAISEEPRIDDVFGLLRNGARSFLVPPLNLETIEQIIIQASEGPQLSDAVLNAPDRNAAFVAVVLNNLYRLASSMRQAREFKTAERDVRLYTYALRESIEMAQLFRDGDDDDLREKIVEGCINRARDAATRLGRLRKKLKKVRAEGDPEEEEEGEEETVANR